MKKLILLITLMMLTAPGFSTTVVVDQSGGGDFTTIHSAVAAAASGDTILVMSGTYLLSLAQGAISITRELHLIGSGYDLPENGGTQIIASSAILSFSANADGSSFSGFRAYGYGTPMINVAADEVVIENNHLTNSYNQGWLMQLSAGITSDTVRNNYIGFNGASNNPGISLDQTIDVTINNNVFFNCSWYGGIYVNGGTNSMITNNLFLSCATGVYTNGSAATIENNIFYNGTNGAGQIYTVSGTPTISTNCFFNNVANGITGFFPILANPSFIDFGNNDTYAYTSYDSDNYNLHLQAGSPCVDAGNASIAYYDLDGSLNDLGAYGGPWPMGTTGAPAMPIINQISVTPTGVAPGGTISIEVIGRFGE